MLTLGRAAAAGRRLGRDSLARNSLLIMATTVVNGGLGYVYWMLAARCVPASEIGTATALISAATAVSMIANLGAGHMFIQRLPGSDPAGWSRIVSGGLVFGAAATAAAATAAALVVPSVAENFGFLSGPSGLAALVCAAVAVTLTTLLDNVYVAHRAGQGMLVRALAVAAGKIVVLLAVLMFGMRWFDTNGADTNWAGAVLVSWTIPTLLVSLLTVVVGPGRLRPGARLRPAGIVRELPHLRTAVTGHHLINLAQAGPAALLPVLVTARLGSDANAHFYLAWMTAAMLFMVSPAVASALYAERTNAANVGLGRAAVVVLAVVGGPAVVLLAAGDAILGMFSAGYADEGGLLLKILVVAALPDAVTNLAVAHWRSRGEFRRCRRLNAVRAASCLLLTWLLLPPMGVTGAGVAWLAGQTASALLVAGLAFRPRPAVAHGPRLSSAAATPLSQPDRAVAHGPGLSSAAATPLSQPDRPGRPDQAVVHGPGLSSVAAAPLSRPDSAVAHGPQLSSVAAAPLSRPDRPDRAVVHGPGLSSVAAAPLSQPDRPGRAVAHGPGLSSVAAAPLSRAGAGSRPGAEGRPEAAGAGGSDVLGPRDSGPDFGLAVGPGVAGGTAGDAGGDGAAVRLSKKKDRHLAGGKPEGL